MLEPNIGRVVLPVKATGTNVRTVEAFADLINESWNKGAGSIIKTARYVVDAKAELASDQFNDLIKNRIFEASVARKFIRIGGNDQICAHVHILPGCWSTIYELTKLEEDILRVALIDGRIHPRMSRKEAKALRAPQSASGSGNTSASSSSESTTISFSDAWDGARPGEITAKIDAVGWNGLCAVLPEKMRPDLLAHEVFVRRQNDQHRIDSEIATLARACNALLEHPEQHVDSLRKKLARIRELSGDDTIARGDGNRTHGKTERGIGAARDAAGRTFTTLTLTPNSVETNPNLTLDPGVNGFRQH
jgi:hypothetical protein